MRTETVAEKRGVWPRMIKMFGYKKGLFALALVLAVVINVKEWVNPYIIKEVIDGYMVGGDNSINVFGLGMAYLAMVALACVSTYAQIWVMNEMGQQIVHKIRMDIIAHIQRMSFKFFDENAAGSVLTRATNDVEALSEVYSSVVVNLFESAVLVIGIIIAMFNMDVGMAAVSFSVLPIIIVITVIYNKKFKENFRVIRKYLGQINAFLAENISGMRLTQIFVKEKQKLAEFLDLNDNYNRANKLAVMMNAMFRPASEMINSLGISILIWFSAGAILDLKLDVGLLFAFITYTRKFFRPIADIADQFTTIQTATVSAERIFELLDNKKFTEDLEVGVSHKAFKGDIEFRHVWFAYNNEDWVLKDISFRIKPGETTAFVGSTGAGKTTIINLIGRFYEIQKGGIYLDGVDVREYPLKFLRERVAVVLQDVFMFEGNILENIRLHNTAITPADAAKAAEFVSADAFITKLRRGYEEPVAERGATLSAGERQLLSFARAIAFDPRVLVLDEATANIDTEHEQIIQSSLEKMMKGRTTIVIAHRLSTIQNANQIIVMSHGEIAERGTHEELLALGGTYKELYEIQFAE